MKKNISFIACLTIAQQACSQTFKPKFNLGLALRGGIHEIEKSRGTLHIYDFNFYGSEQSRSTSLYFGISNEVFNKNWKIELSNYFRYNYFRETQATPTSPYVTERRFKTDHFLDLYYNPTIGKKKNVKLKVGAGYGTTNTNTGFTYKFFTETYDANGNPIFVDKRGSFMYSGPRFLLGASYKKLDATFSLLDSKNNNNEALFSLVIESRFSYNF
jgi:hypothetical protein